MSQNLGYIDLAAVKAAVSLEKILIHYDLLAGLHPEGSGLRGCCPIHKGNDPKQFSVTLPRNLWKCFAQCQHGGNMLEFVMQMENCTLLQAAWKVNGWFQLGHETKTGGRNHPARKAKAEPKAKPEPAVTREATKPTSEPAPAASVPANAGAEISPDGQSEETGENKVLSFTLEHLDVTHPYLAERGLDPETIAHFGIGYCPKGIMAGRIAIPIHNADGHIVANAGRWPGAVPEGKEKYRLPGNFKKTLELFNFHSAAMEPKDHPLVIVEGFFPVLALWRHGVRRVVALMGWFLSDRQEELIARLVTPDSRIVLMLDNDEAGIAATEKAAARLARHCFVRAFRWPGGREQPDELSAEHLAGLS